MRRKVSNTQPLNQTKADLDIVLKCAVSSAFLTRFQWVFFIIKCVSALFKYGTHIKSKLVLKPKTRELDQNYQTLKLSTQK